MPENKAKTKLANNELVLCMAVNQMRSAEVPMIAAACGFDAIYIDLEHSATSLETAAMISVAALGSGITPIARVPSHETFHAARILDAGCQGVMIPHVDTPEQAEKIVTSLRYPPRGMRSAYGTGPSLGYRAIHQSEANEVLNRDELIILLLETPESIERVDEIASVPGVDAIHIGALDVSNLMGIPAAYRDPRMQKVFERVAEACRTHGKAMGVGGARADAELQEHLIRLGVRFLTSGSDVSYLMMAARKEVATLRAIPI